MEQIKESIKDYLDSKSQYALLINGEWGVGKTYFLKNEIISKNNDDEKVFVYISLYGINDVLDIKKKLNLAILSSISKKVKKHEKIVSNIGKGGKALESLITNFLPIGGLTYGIEELFSIIGESQLNSDKKQYILFVDDLERIGDNVNISDCLGLISSDYMENLKCKVVFIANEKEIKNKEEFYKIKEKTIDKTLLFKPTSKKIIHNFLEKSKDSFIVNNIDWISNMYSFYNETINIRTLDAIITNFIDICRNIKKCGIKDNEFCKIEVQKALFLNVMVITEVYKRGHLTSSNINELRYGYRNLKSNNFNDPRENEKTLNNLISNNYYNKMNSEFDNNMFYFGSIDLYIVNAVFEKDKFIKSFDSLLSLLSPTPDLDNYERLIFDFRSMNDAEIMNRQRAVVTSITEKQYNMEELIKIYKHFLDFERMDLLFIESDFKELLEKKIITNYLNLEDVGPLESILFGLINDGYQYTELINLEEKLKNNSLDRTKKYSKKLLLAIFENDSNLIRDYKNNGYQYKIFSTLDDDLMNKYLFVTGNKADRLWEYVRGYYMKYSNIKETAKDELPFINNVIEKIESNKGDDIEKIDKFKMLQLLEVLKELKEKLL